MDANTYAYAYDPIGNRSRSEISNQTSEITAYLANELNQYTNISNGTVEEPTYDLDGNMLTYGAWTFTWNGENRLIGATNSSSGTVIANSYDYMGRRFEKLVDDGSTVTTNTFLYDGWAMIRELTHSQTHTLTNSYVYGLDLSGSMQGAGTIGGLLATVQDGTTYFSCFDANGNLTDYVDEDGTVQAHYEYGPFGGTITSTGDKKDDFRFRFSTKYLDSETDLYYYGYRYYSPELGRWPNRDPIGERGGINLYGFVGNGPLNRADKLGLSVKKCCHALFGKDATSEEEKCVLKVLCKYSWKRCVGTPLGGLPCLTVQMRLLGRKVESANAKSIAARDRWARNFRDPTTPAFVPRKWIPAGGLPSRGTDDWDRLFGDGMNAIRHCVGSCEAARGYRRPEEDAKCFGFEFMACHEVPSIARYRSGAIEADDIARDLGNNAISVDIAAFGNDPRIGVSETYSCEQNCRALLVSGELLGEVEADAAFAEDPSRIEELFDDQDRGKWRELADEYLSRTDLY